MSMQSFVDNTKRYLQMCEKLNWEAKPKDHQLMHLCARSLEMGSPSLHGNWLDEGFKKGT